MKIHALAKIENVAGNLSKEASNFCINWQLFYIPWVTVTYFAGFLGHKTKLSAYGHQMTMTDSPQFDLVFEVTATESQCMSQYYAHIVPVADLRLESSSTDQKGLR